MEDRYIEWIGYAAMLALMIAFTMKDAHKLRFINMIGAGIFVIYGILKNLPPIVIANGFIALINVYYLFFRKEQKVSTEKKQY